MSDMIFLGQDLNNLPDYSFLRKKREEGRRRYNGEKGGKGMREEKRERTDGMCVYEGEIMGMWGDGEEMEEREREFLDVGVKTRKWRVRKKKFMDRCMEERNRKFRGWVWGGEETGERRICGEG